MRCSLPPDSGSGCSRNMTTRAVVILKVRAQTVIVQKKVTVEVPSRFCTASCSFLLRSSRLSINHNVEFPPKPSRFHSLSMLFDQPTLQAQMLLCGMDYA